LALILRGEQRQRLVFHLAAWSLALGTVLLGVITSQSKLFLVLWGLSLYAGWAAGVLILETIMLAAGYKQFA
jgi:hypothetical protein